MLPLQRTDAHRAALESNTRDMPWPPGVVSNPGTGGAFLSNATRDAALAERLVAQYFATYSTPAASSDTAAALTLDECRSAAANAGIAAADIQHMIAQTPFVQLSNDLRDLAQGRAQDVDPANYFHRAQFQPDRTADVLDIGCSTGRLIFANKALTGARLTGLDRSYFSLCIARAAWLRAGLPNAPAWVASDVLAMPFAAASFSHVVSSVTLAHVPLPPALREIRRVIKSGGQFVLTLEGEGFIAELWSGAKSVRHKIDVARVWLGYQLQEHGFEWRHRRGLRRLAGYTAYSPAYIGKCLQDSGFGAIEVSVLKSEGRRPRLIGVSARAI
jgi:SAM-dependent methyltransferase